MSTRLVHYVAAAVLVRLADEGARVVLALLALQHTESAAVGGLLVAALLVPHVAAAPLIGGWADRAHRPGLVIALAATGFAVALAAAGTWLGRAPLGAIVAVLVAGGCCGPALTGALSSLLPALVESERLPRAFGLDSLTFNGAGIIGPAAGALVAAASSATDATYVLAGSAALGAALVTVLPVPARQQRPPAGLGDLLAGTRVIVRDRILAVVTAATSIGQLGMGALPIIAALIAGQYHSPAAAGWLLGAVAAGGILGSLAWTWRPARPEQAATLVMLGLVGVGLPLGGAAFAASSSLPATAALFALAGFSNGPLFGALLVTRNDRAPIELRSQVFTLGAGAKISATAAGAALAGLLSGHTPIVVLLLLAAASSVLPGALGHLVAHWPQRRAGAIVAP